MEQLNTYLNLCTQVYDLSKPKLPEDIYTFYKHYVKQANGTVLEPMCGTGRFLLPLLKEGYDVHGFDASEHMLNALHEKAKRLGLKANAWQGYAQELLCNERYSLIFIPSGSFCLITEPDEIATILKLFYEHLTDDGIFLFEIETKHAVPPLGVWRGSKWFCPDGKMILLSSCAFMESDICSFIGKYELINNNCIVQTEIEEYKVKIHDSAVLTEALQQAGFKRVKKIKAFNHCASPDKNDENIVYECRK